MRIAVVGAGAMGSIFGARFTQAGHDTVLVDVAVPLVETINADGVTIVRGEEETMTRVPATTDPGAVGVVDVVVGGAGGGTAGCDAGGASGVASFFFFFFPGGSAGGVSSGAVVVSSVVVAGAT